MISTFKLKIGLRLRAGIILLAFAHEVIAGGYVPFVDGGGVPPSSTPSASTRTTSVPPPAWTTTSSVPQLDADTSCSNNPCLKAPEASVYRPGEMVEVSCKSGTCERINSGSGADAKFAVGIVKDIALDEIGNKIPLVKVYTEVTSPTLTGLQDLKVIGKPAALGLGVFFETIELGDGTLPPELQHWNAKNAAENADRQKRIDFFNNLQKTNIEQKEKAKAEAEKQQFEAAKQRYAEQQENRGLQELVGTYLSGMAQMQQMKQQSTPASSPRQIVKPFTGCILADRPGPGVCTAN